MALVLNDEQKMLHDSAQLFLAERALCLPRVRQRHPFPRRTITEIRLSGSKTRLFPFAPKNATFRLPLMERLLPHAPFHPRVVVFCYPPSMMIPRFALFLTKVAMKREK